MMNVQRLGASKQEKKSSEKKMNSLAGSCNRTLELYILILELNTLYVFLSFVFLICVVFLLRSLRFNKCNTQFTELIEFVSLALFFLV